MNVKIVYADISEPFCRYEKFLTLVSEERRKKISRLCSQKDKIVSLFTGLLIAHEIEEQLGIPRSEMSFGRGEHGKPYLLNDRDFHFSVSHSGSCIAFAANGFPVGIDTERIACVKTKVAERFFTLNERGFIESSPEPELAFYKIWTAKEAYVKMLGAGLSRSFRSFDVLEGISGCGFASVRIPCSVRQPCSAGLPEYMLTVCAENFDGILTVDEISAESLLQ